MTGGGGGGLPPPAEWGNGGEPSGDLFHGELGSLGPGVLGSMVRGGLSGGGGRWPPPTGRGGRGEPGCGSSCYGSRGDLEMQEDGRSPVQAVVPARNEEGKAGSGEGFSHGIESMILEVSGPEGEHLSSGDGGRPDGVVLEGPVRALNDTWDASTVAHEGEITGRQALAMKEDGIAGDMDVQLGAGNTQGKGGKARSGGGILPSPSACLRLDAGKFLATDVMLVDDQSKRLQDVRGKACEGVWLREGGLGSGNVWQRPRVMALPPVVELGIVSMDGTTTLLDGDEVAATSSRFQEALVGRLFGRRIPFHILSGELNRRWSPFGKFKIVTLSGDCFICMFDTVEARDAVFLGGPWILFGQVLGIDQWTPSFSLSSAAGFFTPVWVRLPELPLYCWSPKNIARIVARIGEPMWLDAATAQFDRGAYARICVRVDLSKNIQPGVWVEGPHGKFYQPVVYECLSVLCWRCGQVGHKESSCSVQKCDRPTVQVTSRPSPMVGTSAGRGSTGGSTEVVADPRLSHPRMAVGEGSDEMADRGVGPWMVVARKKHSGKGKGGGVLPQRQQVQRSNYPLKHSVQNATVQVRKDSSLQKNEILSDVSAVYLDGFAQRHYSQRSVSPLKHLDQNTAAQVGEGSSR